MATITKKRLQDSNNYADSAGNMTELEYNLTTTAVVLLIVLSELNFRFIETPLRKHGVEVARRLAARKIAEPDAKGSD